MTTVVGFVITGEKFVVFHSGDGVIAVNGQFSILNSESGRYFSNDLLYMCCPNRFSKPETPSSLQVFASGEAKSVQSIFVATDGMSSLVKDHAGELSKFVQRAPVKQQCQDGFDFALEEFRRDFAWNPKIAFNLGDDAAFTLLRRIATI